MCQSLVLVSVLALAGAMKNIIAIAAGIIDGAGAGDNAKAALLTRGLAEISRLGIACKAKPQTFAGLTGLGDLVTTCISPTRVATLRKASLSGSASRAWTRSAR